MTSPPSPHSASTRPPGCVRRFYRTNLHQIAYIRFIVESYEGLVLMTSLPGRCELEWVIPEGQADLAAELAEALAHEVTLVAIPKPMDWPAQR